MLWKAKLDDQWYATVSGQHEGKYLPVASEPQAKHEEQVRRALDLAYDKTADLDDVPVLPYLIKDLGELIDEGARTWAEAESEVA